MHSLTFSEREWKEIKDEADRLNLSTSRYIVLNLRGQLSKGEKNVSRA